MKPKSKAQQIPSFEFWETKQVHRVFATVALLVSVTVYCFSFAWGDGRLRPSVMGSLLTGFIAWILFICFVLLRRLVANRLAEDLIYLAAETAHEAGPDQTDLTQAGETFDQMVEFFDKIRLRGTHQFLCKALLINPEHIRSILSTASNSISHSQRLDNIQNAAQPVAALCERCYESYGGILHRWGYRLLGVGSPAALEVEKAVRNFVRKVELLRSTLNFGTVKEACLASRTAGFLVHCSGPGIISIELLASFKNCLLECESHMSNLAKTDSLNQATLKCYLNSVKRRREALVALQNGEAEILWKTLTSEIA